MKSQAKFEKLVRNHFSEYRKTHLAIHEDGMWRGRKYGHILPKYLQKLNLLESIREEFWKENDPLPFSLHKGFANLNSSQAMTFNFFWPFVKKPSLFSKLPGMETVALKESVFEKVIIKDEGTNLDWWGKTKAGGEIFCEAKFKESFGRATSKMTDYEQRWKSIYIPKLDGIIDESRLNDFEWFKGNYQIVRNLWHLQLGEDPGKNRLIFFLPRLSPSFEKLEKILAEVLTPRAQKQVTIAGLEDWTKAMIDSTDDPHWTLFKNKYVIQHL